SSTRTIMSHKRGRIGAVIDRERYLSRRRRNSNWEFGNRSKMNLIGPPSCVNGYCSTSKILDLDRLRIAHTRHKWLVRPRLAGNGKVRLTAAADHCGYRQIAEITCFDAIDLSSDNPWLRLGC